jgi:formylglycine-generating enzyme required for sulfatase activity
VRSCHGYTVTDDASSGERELARPSKIAVPLAALLIVGAVWLALQLSRSAPAGSRTETPSPTAALELPGLRSDTWFLPAEELLGFVEIPAGVFLMGSDPAVDPRAFDLERWSSTSAQGTVDLPTFYMGRYEVTVAQLSAFAEATGHTVGSAGSAGPLRSSCELGFVARRRGIRSLARCRAPRGVSNSTTACLATARRVASLAAYRSRVGKSCTWHGRPSISLGERARGGPRQLRRSEYYAGGGL